MTDTLRSVIEEELQKAYERGVQDGMKQEHALWELAKIGQEIELGITYEEANPPQPYCKRCGKKLGTEAYDVHTCTPKEIDPELAFIKDWNEGKVRRVSDGEIMQPMPQMQTRVTTPPKKEWRGLTYADLYFWGGELGLGELGKGVLRAVDAHLREKNT